MSADPLEIEENSQTEIANFNRNLLLAETVAIVQNGFITKEQTAYCLGWKDLVNSNSRVQTVLYSGMGPDVATVLLTTDATTIYGVDTRPPSTDKTSHYLATWEKVDTDVVSLPPENDYYIDRYHKEGLYTPTDETAMKELQETLRLRAARGYWDMGEMETWSIDRCLVIELKKLGIKPNEVTISNANGQLQLDFSWAFAGQEVKPRRVIYIKGMTYDITDNPNEYHLPQLDGFYEKSVQTGNRGTDLNDLLAMRAYIKPGGFVLIGRSHGTDEEEARLEEANRAALGGSFKPLNIFQEYKNLVHQKLQGEHASRYGWELYGARKVA